MMLRAEGKWLFWEILQCCIPLDQASSLFSVINQIQRICGATVVLLYIRQRFHALYIVPK